MTDKTYEGYALGDVPKYPQQKRITSVGSGSVPLELRGMYTSFKECMNAIDTYKLSQAKRKKTDAKEDAATGDAPVRPRASNGSKSPKLST